MTVPSIRMRFWSGPLNSIKLKNRCHFRVAAFKVASVFYWILYTFFNLDYSQIIRCKSRFCFISLYPPLWQNIENLLYQFFFDFFLRGSIYFEIFLKCNIRLTFFLFIQCFHIQTIKTIYILYEIIEIQRVSFRFSNIQLFSKKDAAIVRIYICTFFHLYSLNNGYKSKYRYIIHFPILQ